MLLSVARIIDAVNVRVGRLVMWLVLAAVLVSAYNAIVRKAFGMGSNAYLELQWYLFSAVFLLAAGYTLLRNEHVRIDAVAHRFSRRTQVFIDVIGIVLFLLPLCWWVVSLSLPLAVRAWRIGEISSNAGGLIRWPVYALIPLGFTLLGLQGVSELIKRLAFLTERAPDPAVTGREPTTEGSELHDTRRLPSER